MAPLNLSRGSTEIDLRAVPEGVHPVTLRENGSAGDGLAIDAEMGRFLSEYRFTGFLEWIPENRRVRGVLEGRFRSLCDRCLVPFEQGVRVEIDVPLIVEAGGTERGSARTGVAAGPDPWEDEAAEGAVRISAEDPALDLAEPFRAAVLLEVPIKNLCREDCRGLCPVCGADRNRVACTCEPPRGDPRWEALGGISFPPKE